MSLGAFLERRRVALSWVFAAVYLILAAPTHLSLAAGMLPMAAGAALRTWASGHIRKQKRLATGGPYAYTRNPLYAGSFLIAAGALIMARSWIMALVFAATALPLYATVMAREEKILADKFGDDFDAYRQAVPFILPRLSPYRKEAAGKFDLQLVHKHREWLVWIAIAALIGFLVFRAYAPSP